MPGTNDPQHGLQAYAAKLQALVVRITNLETWQRQASSIMQPGVITQWGGSSPPAGALDCNGATFSGSMYPQLAAALGGTTLPNIAGSVIWTGPQSSV